MTKNLFIMALATALFLGCSTTGRTGKTEVEDPAATAANAAEIAARARAAETLAAIPCRCDSIGNNPPLVKFLRLPEPLTHQPQFDILCKTEYPATVSINGKAVKQYKTGIFFMTVPFDEGVNMITAEAVYPDGRKAVCERAVIYEKRDLGRQPFSCW